MKKILITILIYCYAHASTSATTLNPGDLAFTAFNFKDPDKFSFVTFINIEEGTIIYFTDSGWQDNNTFREGEGLITYTVPAGGLNARDVVTYPTDAGFITEGISGFFGFAVAGDQIISFQGGFTSPSFIYALTNGYGWQSSATNNNTSALPPGLIDGQTALTLLGEPNAYYDCSLDQGPLNLLLNKISTSTNWNDSSNPVNVPSSCFQIPLRIEITNFGIIKNEINYQACGEINCSNETIVYLEKSISGTYFNKTDSLKISSGGISNICFIIPNENSYYRLVAKEENQNIEIATPIKFTNKNYLPQKLWAYNLQGTCLYFSTEDNRDLQIIAKNIQASGIVIFRTIDNNGNIEVNKIYLRED